MPPILIQPTEGSIGIPFHAGGDNAPHWRNNLRRMLTSLARAGSPDIARRWEIIVCELGSNSQADIILPDAPARMRHYVWPSVQWNVSTARNAALRLARGDYFVSMDADGIVVPPFYDILTMLLRQNAAEYLIVPEYAVVTPRVADELVEYPHNWKRALREFMKMSDVNHKKLVMEGALMATRREFFEKCAGFDENFLGGHMAGTDVDMRERLYNAGVKDSILFGYMLAHVGQLTVHRNSLARPLPVEGAPVAWTDDDIRKWRGDTFDISKAQPHWGFVCEHDPDDCDWTPPPRFGGPPR